MQSEEAIQIAKRDLEKLLNQPITDPAQTSRTAFKASIGRYVAAHGTQRAIRSARTNIAGAGSGANRITR